MPPPQLAIDFSPSTASAAPGLEGFHPLVQAWFQECVGTPSPPQLQGWPLIREGRDVLIAAPTGSGKTLSAFLACVDDLFRRSLDDTLPDHTQVVYASPLKALSNDVQKNLLGPLEALRQRALAAGMSPKPIRVLVRTGDTPASERAAMLKRPPHILITTPESLYLTLTAQRSRETLRQVRTVVVDEIHALARDKRGAHLALSLERLDALVGQRAQRIGLSATQKPIEQIASFLTGAGARPGGPCAVVEVGHLRPWELTLETPEEELTAVATHEMWGQVYDRLVALAQDHRTMVIFTNTRKLAERVAHDLGQRLGDGATAAHHGSLSRELRLRAEERLKAGELKVMVATASLELGIDVGAIDLVVQLGSPRAIAALLQRVGRAGHHFGGISKGILYAMTRDELVECAALLAAVKAGDLDAVRIPPIPVDVLAQQVVAEVACQPWQEEALYDVLRRAHPYRAMPFEEFEQVLKMLSEGAVGGRPAGLLLHRDRVNGVLRPRKAARLQALQNGGAIPDTFTYPVVAEPEDVVVGALDEDFAIDSSAGDVFLLGSTSWRVRRVMAGTVRVENAHGAPPSVPFWRGEAPARTEELSRWVGTLREEVLRRDDPLEWLSAELGVPLSAAELLVRYVRAGHAALGAVPSFDTVVAERFFDDAGGMQLIIHAPFGGRINRAWGMALRKRFCRSFDFELQAAASDDGILLSLGEQHSFPLADIFDFLSADNVEEVLVQAVLQAPMFGTRFRWCASRALALSRFRSGQRVPPQIQRSRSDDLLAAVFPAQVGCQDNHGGGDIEVPNHPLVNETLKDCLSDAMDLEGLKQTLRRLRSGQLRRVAVDVPEPSVFAHQMLNSAPYTYLDDAPLEERRARAVTVRRTLPAEDAAAFGALDVGAITQVVADAQPLLRDAEELHDCLLQLGWVPASAGLPVDLLLLESLARSGRAAAVVALEPDGARAVQGFVATERLPVFRALFPSAQLDPPLEPLLGDAPVDEDAAAQWVVRGWMDISGPLEAAELAARLHLRAPLVTQALFRLEGEGQAVRGSFCPGCAPGREEWCNRRLLQRIHRLTVGRLRRDIEPLSAQDYMRFLFRWHHLTPGEQLSGPHAVERAVALLQGYEAPAAAWEQWLLPARLKHYQPEQLERACWGGEVVWGRLFPREVRMLPGPRRGLAVSPELLRPMLPGRSANITFARREAFDWMVAAARADEDGLPSVSDAARGVLAVLERRGACFFADLQLGTGLEPGAVEDALWELLSAGRVSADAVENLRVLQSPRARRQQRASKRGGPGRWSLIQPVGQYDAPQRLEHAARLLLARYGIVVRDVALREPLAPPWRELSQFYRRLEGRGELRGGRFLAGFAGEQFGLPEAVDLARAVRRVPPSGQRVTVAAVDPLNLTGVVTPGPRVAAVLGHEVVYVDGVPEAGRTPALEELDAQPPMTESSPH